jgi:trehalose 6-phosphate synthase
MAPEQRAEWSQGLRDIIFSRNPGDWVDDQLADIEKARSDSDSD